MKPFFHLKTIHWLFLIVYLLSGGTQGIARCIEGTARTDAAAVDVNRGSTVLIQQKEAPDIPVPSGGRHTGPRSCLKLPPALGLTLAESIGKLPWMPTAHSSRAVCSAFFRAVQNDPRLIAQPPPPIHPQLAQIRTVVLLN